MHIYLDVVAKYRLSNESVFAILQESRCTKSGRKMTSAEISSYLYKEQRSSVWEHVILLTPEWVAII